MLPGDQDGAAAQDGGQAVAPAAGEGQPAVYGDAAYGSGELIAQLDDAGICNGIKCQPPAAVKDHFPRIASPSTRPALPARPASPYPSGLPPGGTPGPPGSPRPAGPARWPPGAPPPKEGRTITIGPHEAQLAAARVRQEDPAWKADYRATTVGPPKPRRPRAHPPAGHLGPAGSLSGKRRAAIRVTYERHAARNTDRTRPPINTSYLGPVPRHSRLLQSRAGRAQLAPASQPRSTGVVTGCAVGLPKVRARL